MKTLITCLLSLSILPVALSAQPVISTNEYYHIGDVITMVNCDPSAVVAGSPGANVMWDFTGLTASGGLHTTYILNDTSVIFSTSNIMEIMPDGTILFVNENNNDSYIDGKYDGTTHLTTFYSLYDDSKRPFTYNTNYVDTYQLNITTTGLFGTGCVYEVGDAYGTLMLPGGATYSNVLRIKKVITEYDTAGLTATVSQNISYLWFDTAHAAPLLRIDSSNSSSTSNQRVMYLAPATGIADLPATQATFTGYLDNSEHLFVNGFEAGKTYQVTLYNIIGNKIHTESFTATSSQQRFEVAKQLAPGIYVVSIAARGEPNAPSVIKLVKQE